MQTATSPASTSRSIHSLETLAARSQDELDALYRAAVAPSSMHAIDGPLVGRMLVVRGVPPILAKPLRRWAGSPSFIWEGKTFQATSDTAGVGHNRVSIPGALGRQNLFPFATRFEPSSLDGKPSLILDYDLDVNPGYIRGIHDEIREVSPGLFLGPAMWKRGDQRTFLLWFALDVGQA
ncbi:MAG: hypothetical protein H0T89_18300 [Deltaproteobacteria bacterium]|nr:hypothetical protein [Deltaproteobacteria bacterium]